MVALADLWLPILLSAVFVFIASSVIHMALPWHKKDYRGLPDEDAVLDVLRSTGTKSGDYMFPFCEGYAESNTDEMKAKFEKGPVGTLTIWPEGGFNMGTAMGAWFGFTLLVSLFSGYLCTLSAEAGADYGTVQQIAGTAGILGFAFWHVPVSVWKGVRWSTTLRFVLDGILYGLIVGGTFGWLWPAAAAA